MTSSVVSYTGSDSSLLVVNEMWSCSSHITTPLCYFTNPRTLLLRSAGPPVPGTAPELGVRELLLAVGTAVLNTRLARGALSNNNNKLTCSQLRDMLADPVRECAVL